MTRTEKHLISLLIAGALVIGMLVTQILQNPEKAMAGTGMGEGMISTSTPNLANNTVLCSNGGVLGSVIAHGAHSGYLWVINASSTVHTHFATTSAILAEFPTGYGTTSAEYGAEAGRGLVVSYTGTGTTTITYRCGA